MHPQAFTIKANIGTKYLLDLLSKEYSLHEKQQMQIQRCFLDSFDWRLYKKTYICWVDKTDNLQKFFLGNSKHSFAFPINKLPVFPKDIAHDKCRRLLESILELRALIRVASVNIQQKQLHIVNNEHKTLSKLYIENYNIPGHTDTAEISRRLIIFPLKGYAKISQRVVQFISQQTVFSQASTNLLQDILTSQGKWPVGKELQITKQLDESLSAWEALKILFGDLLKIMRANEQGIREAIDTEFLHDFRVAVRRTRTLLTQFKHLLTDEQFNYFKQEFYWLGLITSPTRDLDVYLLKYDSYIKMLPQRFHTDLVPFQQFLRRQWKLEHARLCSALDSKRYDNLMRNWEQLLKRKKINSPQAVNAAKPAKLMANKRIWKLYKKILTEGSRITMQSPDDDLHELRKTCKKFRYLMEFFQSYYPENQMKRLIKYLKLLQDNLGNFQDLSVQTKQIREFAQQMQAQGQVAAATIMAMGVLVESLDAKKKLVRFQFNQRFKEFTSAEKMKEFKTVFGHKKHLNLDSLVGRT